MSSTDPWALLNILRANMNPGYNQQQNPGMNPGAPPTPATAPNTTPSPSSGTGAMQQQGLMGKLGGLFKNPQFLQTLAGIAMSQGKNGGARGAGFMNQMNLQQQAQLEQQKATEEKRRFEEELKIKQEKEKREREQQVMTTAANRIKSQLDLAKYESDQFASAELAITNLAKERDFSDPDSVTSYIDATESIIANRGMDGTTNAEALRSYAKSVAKMPGKKATAETTVTLAERAARGDEVAKKALELLQPQRSTGQYDLALRAAQGDKDAQKALDLLKKSDEAAKVVQIKTVDENGKPIIRFVTPRPGMTYPTLSEEDKPPNQAERVAMKYWERGTAAENVLSQYENVIQNYGFLDQLNLNSGNAVTQGAVMEQYASAMKQFTEARLRKDSGAAIPKEEYENDRKMYFAQPGDSQETVEKKRQARIVTLNAIARESGNAYAREFGEPPPPPKPAAGDKPKPIVKTMKVGQIIQMKNEKGERRKASFIGGDPNSPDSYKDLGPWGGK